MFIHEFKHWTIEEAKHVLRIFGISTDRTEGDIEATIEMLIEDGKLQLRKEEAYPKAFGSWWKHCDVVSPANRIDFEREGE